MELGEVRQLGRHRLMCGDAFNLDHVDRLLDGAKPDMLYCDPPYGMRLNAGSPTMKGYGIAAQDKIKFRDVAGDDADFDPSILLNRFSSCPEQFWWGADYYAERIVNRNDGAWLVWDKRLEESADKMFGSGFEMCWSRKRHQRAVIRIQWAGLFGLHREPGKTRVHPTQKPVVLAEWFLRRFSEVNDVICDLFAGSGSALLGCERMDRTALCMEIDPVYCDVIVDRYTEMAKQPRLMEAM